MERVAIPVAEDRFGLVWNYRLSLAQELLKLL